MSDPISYLQEWQQNTLWVAKNGSDTRYGLTKYSFSRPFLTIQAAITAASAGDLVMIMPGTYLERLTLKNGVNLYGFSGVTIGYTPTADYQTLVTDGGASCACAIKGDISFEIYAASYTAFGFNIEGASTIRLDCNRVIRTAGAGTLTLFRFTAGTMYATCTVSALTGGAFSLSGGGANVYVRNSIITGNISSIVSQVAGNISFTNCSFTGTSTSVLDSYAGNVTLVGCDMTCTTMVLALNGASSGIIHCRDCEITAGATGTGYVIEGSTSTNKTVFLKNCTLRPAGTATHCVNSNATGALTLKLLNCFGTLPATGGAGTITVSVNDFFEDSEA